MIFILSLTVNDLLDSDYRPIGVYSQVMEQLQQTPDKDGAVKIIDKAMAHLGGRDLVSTGEITDVLLDVRLCLVPATAAAE